MQSYNPAILGSTFSRLLKVAKLVNKKNAGKPHVLALNALLHSLAALSLAATFSTVAFYFYF